MSKKQRLLASVLFGFILGFLLFPSVSRFIENQLCPPDYVIECSSLPFNTWLDLVIHGDPE